MSTNNESIDAGADQHFGAYVSNGMNTPTLNGIICAIV